MDLVTHELMARWVRALALGLALLVTPVAASAASAANAEDDANVDRAPADEERTTWGIAPASADGPDGRPSFDYIVQPEERYDDHVAIRNIGAEPVTLSVYAGDASTTSVGAFDLLARDEVSVGAGSWIELAEPEVTIPPRDVVVVPFRITVPDDAEPGDHAAGIVASMVTTGEGGSDATFDQERRVGARVYLRVAGPIEASVGITLDEASYALPIVSVGGGRVEVDATIVNEGNLRLTVAPRLLIEGPFGIGDRALDGEPVGELLPGSSVRIALAADDVLPTGRLRVTVEAQPVASAGQALDLPPEPATASVTLWAVPWAVLVLVALLAAVAVAVVRRHRRRRAEERASEPGPVPPGEALEEGRAALPSGR